MTYLIEHWKPVVGFEGWYEVSSIGRIRRARGGKGAVVGRILKFGDNGNGYLNVILTRECKAYRYYVHSVVASAFIGRRPLGCEVNHKDGNKQNCSVANIEYVSSTENKLHAYATGLRPRGENISSAVLHEAQVQEIKRAMVSNNRKDLLAKFPNINESTLNNIYYGLCWTHVTA